MAVFKATDVYGEEVEIDLTQIDFIENAPHWGGAIWLKDGDDFALGFDEWQEFLDLLVKRQ